MTRSARLRVVQLILLLPSTLFLAPMALLSGAAGIGGSLGTLAFGDVTLRSVEGRALLLMVGMFFVLFVVPAVGFVLLWVLILMGPAWMAKRRWLAWTTIVVGLMSCGVVAWLGFGGPPATVGDAVFARVMFLTPAVIGLVNLTVLIAKLRTAN